ncbi:MAG TPA: prepilin-type N-terminal cleavage/methylation domain-containing protein [Euzebya sp.]|nr:prepilin-type N-terminal cleavage/methylation domain-containing protein [Euzebya sp.]
MPSRTDDENGFSLVELLVVVIIVGILAAIAIPTFLSQRQRGWQAQLTSDVRNAILDVEAQFVTNSGQYPADQAEFDALGAATSDISITLTYDVNAARDAFCVLGRDVRQPVGNQQVAHYVSGGGVQVFQACPPL